MREVGRRVSWGISLLLALAVSIDGFSVGFSCGLRRLVIPFTSLLAICLLSMAAVAVSLLAGSGVAHLFPFHYISAFGGAVLILLGLYIIGQYLTVILADPVAEIDLSETGSPGERPQKFISLLRRPEEADLDRSGTLSIREALLLGSALAADALAAGFGAALIGLSFMPTVLAVGLAKLALLPLGAALGRMAVRGTSLPHTPIWGGAILIIIGIINLF